MRLVYLLIIVFIPNIIASCFFWETQHVDTRKAMTQNRRLSTNNRTILSKKHAFFKQAFQESNTNNQGEVALKMNLLEKQYNIPYFWGGDIRNFKQGIDCSGFIHGLMYYSGEIGYNSRFNTAALFRMLKRDKDYIHVYSAKTPDGCFNVEVLQIGDIILWPSGIADGRNIPGNIIGHVGIVSDIRNNEPYVTHYVDAPKYNDVDKVGESGSGINTMNATDFIAFKERGQLNIFRKKELLLVNK